MVIKLNESLQVPRALYRKANLERGSEKIPLVLAKGSLVTKERFPKEIYEWLLSLDGVVHRRQTASGPVESTLVTVVKDSAPAKKEPVKPEAKQEVKADKEEQTEEVAPPEVEPSKRGRKKAE